MNVVDTLLLSFLATLCHILLSSNSESKTFLPLMQTLFLIPLAIFILLNTTRLVCGICGSNFLWSRPLEISKAASNAADVSLMAQLQHVIKPTATYGST